MAKKLTEVGVSLTGGGARGAYQAGALQGIAEILKEQRLTGRSNPLQYWSAVSAGSINAASCVAGIHDLKGTTARVASLWQNISPDEVYLSDFTSLSTNGIKWVRDLAFGSLIKSKLAHSLLDTAPLWDLLQKSMDYEIIDRNIAKGYVKGLACTAYSYRDSRTVTFLQTKDPCSWDKPKRYSRQEKIRNQHVIASCAIPLLFPSVKVDGEYFADGSFRNTTPVSPLIHMGAKKLLVIGVRGTGEFSEMVYPHAPTIAKVAGSILNSLFFDTTDLDLERVTHLNEMVAAMKKDIVTQRSDYSTINYHLIRPSRDISKIAEQKFKNFPRMLKFMIGGLGPRQESSELASYILFVPEFTRELVSLGYEDVMKSKAKLIQWFESE